MIVHLVSVAVAVGAWTHVSVGGLAVAMAIGAALRWRRSGAVVVAALLVAGWWSARALDDFVPPPAGPVDAWVTLTADPRPSGPVGVRASGVWGTHRVSVSAHGAVAGRLDDRLAGEQIRVVGPSTGTRA